MSGGLLCLDPSTELIGWAATESRDSRFALYDHYTIKFEGELIRTHAGRIASRFERFLQARIEVLRPAAVVREGPYIDKRHPERINPETILGLAGIAWQIERIADDRGIPCYVADSQAAVKALTSRGRFPGATYEARRKAKKRATVAALEMLGFKGITEDEADALAILIFEEPRIFPEMRLRLVRPVNMPLFQNEDPYRSDSHK